MIELIYNIMLIMLPVIYLINSNVLLGKYTSKEKAIKVLDMSWLFD